MKPNDSTPPIHLRLTPVLSIALLGLCGVALQQHLHDPRTIGLLFLGALGAGLMSIFWSLTVKSVSNRERVLWFTAGAMPVGLALLGVLVIAAFAASPDFTFS